MSRKRFLAVVVAAVTGLLAMAGPARGAVVTNGDFETGNLAGWQHADSPDSTTGSWFAYTGTSAPLFGASISAPPQGMWAAVTDQDFVSRQILYQDVSVPKADRAELSAWVYYRSNSTLTTQPNLDENGSSNQQYRFDLTRPAAAIDSVASGDVLATLFQTATGGPEQMAPTRKIADLSSFVGQTVRLRLAEVNNEGNFWASADGIAVSALTVGKPKLNKGNGTAKLPVTVTDPGTVSLTGKGVKRRSAPASKSVATQGGAVKLVVKPKGKTARKLNDAGKAKVKVTITYTPTGGTSLTETKKLKLKKT